MMPPSSASCGAAGGPATMDTSTSSPGGMRSAMDAGALPPLAGDAPPAP